MLNGGKANGFTIVETMIFLTVTGVLLFSTLNAIRGRQAVVEFQQGTRDFQSKINDIMSQVSNGFYPNDNKVKCMTPMSGQPVLTPAGPGNTRGTSDDCVFLGKVIKFNAGSDFSIMSIASRRYAPGTSQDSQSFADAQPIAVYGSPVDITENTKTSNGISVTCVSVGPTCALPGKGAVLIIGSFPATSSSGALTSGAQKINFGILPSSSLSDSLSTTASEVTNLSSAGTGFLDQPGGVVVCVIESGGNRRAKLTIGGIQAGNGQLLSNLDVLNTGDTSCP